MSASSDAVSTLLDLAGLSTPRRVEPLEGRGFDNKVLAVRMDDGTSLLARLFPRPRAPEVARFRFFAQQQLRVPRLLAATEQGSLYQFIDGELLGDSLERAAVTDDLWRAVGAAFRAVHAVRFPNGLSGNVHPDRVELRPAADAVQEIHKWLDAASAGLNTRAPDAIAHLPRLRRLVDDMSQQLRSGSAALLHGDPTMWNIIVTADSAWLIDWDEPKIGDPRREIGLLDKHASLFNGSGLPASFFEGYGTGRDPVMSFHRLVGTVAWVASSDWEAFTRKPLPTTVRTYTRAWLETLLTQLVHLPAWLSQIEEELRTGTVS